MRGAPVQGDSKITLPSRGETWRQFGSGTACARGVRAPAPRTRVGFGLWLHVRACVCVWIRAAANPRVPLEAL